MGALQGATRYIEGNCWASGSFLTVTQTEPFDSPPGHRGGGMLPILPKYSIV